MFQKPYKYGPAKWVQREGPEMLDHGYAVTSHGSQGLTADRVLINIDTAVNPQLINSRFAYVSVSRAAIDARIFANDSSGLAQNLEHDVAKTSAVDFFQSANHGLSDTGLGENL
jgi:ATP-dependent exoDNAse (exonuclease V) alpha subunit